MGIRDTLKGTLLALWLPGLVAAADRADVSELHLEDLLRVEVSGAARYVQPLAEAPATATVISAEDIRRFGYRQLGEALESVRGVHVSKDRSYDYIGVRGFSRPGDYNTRVLTLVDGARLNNPIYDQAMIGGESPIDLDWVKRIEFAPGPASASYGGNALFGVINTVLWSGAELDGARVSLDAGSGRAGRASLLAGRREAGGLDWVAGLSVEGRRGGDLYFAEHGGTAHGLDAERGFKAMLRGQFADWQLTALVAERRKDVPTAYYQTLFDTPGNFNRDREAHLGLIHGSALGPHLDQQLRLHLGRYAYDADYPYANLRNRDEARARWWSAEYQLSWQGWADHRLLAGVELRRGRMLQRNADVAPPAAPVLDDAHGLKAWGVFIQDEWRLAPRWLLNLGLRHDRVGEAAGISSPRAALIWRARDDLTVKAIGGRAFRAANDYERHYDDGGNAQKGNPDLRPERIRTRELAFDYTPSARARLGLSLYHYRLRDLIDAETDPADDLLVFRNQPELRAHGLEVDGEARLAGGWRLRGSMAWQGVRQSRGEAINSPARVGKLLLDGPLPWAGEGATLGLSLSTLSRRRTLLGHVPGHLMADLTLRSAPAAGGVWSLAIRNLGNSRWRDPVGAEQNPIDSMERDGRQWRLRWELAL